MKNIKCPLRFKDPKDPSDQELSQLSFIMAKQLEGLSCSNAHKVLTDAIDVINWHTNVALGPGFEAEMTKYPPCLSGVDIKTPDVTFKSIKNITRGRL